MNQSFKTGITVPTPVLKQRHFQSPLGGLALRRLAFDATHSCQIDRPNLTALAACSSTRRRTIDSQGSRSMLPRGVNERCNH